MNEFGPLNEHYAQSLMRQRAEAGLVPREARSARRRTTRRTVASGLHRLADRLDGGI